MKRKLLILGVVATALLVGAGTVLAGTTGKINGVARDQSGAVLPGANVVIKELNLGGTADADGYYVIINIPPGRYTLTASLIGYETVTQTGVGIAADRTSTINFNLKETALELGELVVTAGRPLVEADKTTSKYTVDLEETERYLASARRTQELLQLQPGVAVDGSNRIRGGQTNMDQWSNFHNQVAYVVDGVRLNYNDGRGNGAIMANVNRGQIQELSVLTGVTPAEYGDIQAGVVSIITKDGGSDYHGWGEFRYEPAGKKHWGENVYDSPQHQGKVFWDDPDWLNEKWPDLYKNNTGIHDRIFDVADANKPDVRRLAGSLIHVRSDYEEWSGMGLEGNLSGPLGDRASFVVSAKHDRFATPSPGPERVGFYDDRGAFVGDPGNINWSASVTLKPSQNLKLKIGSIFQNWDRWSDGRPDPSGKSRQTATLQGVVRNTGSGLRNIFLPEKWSAAGLEEFQEDMQYAVFTHTLSPRTFYEVRIQRSRSQQDTIGGQHDTTKADNLDAAGWFSIGRQVARYGLADRTRYSLKFDISSQMTKGNFVKAGLEFITSRIEMWQRWDSSTGNRGIVMINNKGVIGEKVKPFFLNAYVQDKMEFQGMIVNLGVRMDTFNPNSRQLTFGTFRGSPMYRYYTRARDWAYQDGNLWSTDAPWHMRFSPRIGVSHPITERSQMRFSTGVFLQWADLWYYFGEDYWAESAETDRDINGNGTIDAAERYNSFFITYSGRCGLHLLSPAKTTAFEVGSDWNFVSDYTATLTAYYKSEVDHFTSYPNETWVGPADVVPRYSRTLDNGAHGDIRGVELAVRKAFSHNFSFNVSYNFQYSQVTTGKLGNVIRNAYMDSLAVVRLAGTTMFTEGGVQVPGFWVFFDAGADGREIPRRLTGADLEFYASQGQSKTNGARNSGALGTGIWDGLRPVDSSLGEGGGTRVNSKGETIPSNVVMINTGSYTTLFHRSRSGDRRNFGAVSLLASFPDDFEFGNMLVSNALRNVRVNLTSRIQTGGIYQYTPPTGGTAEWRDLALDSRTDLAIEKTFNAAGRIQPTIFADIRNVFGQKDRSSPTNRTNYTYLGIEGPAPDDKTYLQYGDTRDRTYAHTPRLVHFGARINW